jgi:hypothetical protein
MIDDLTENDAWTEALIMVRVITWSLAFFASMFLLALAILSS